MHEVLLIRNENALGNRERRDYDVTALVTPVTRARISVIAPRSSLLRTIRSGQDSDPRDEVYFAQSRRWAELAFPSPKFLPARPSEPVTIIDARRVRSTKSW